MTFITRLVAGYGSAAVAGFSLASRIETMLAMVVWQFQSVGPCGQNWGARKFERVWKAVSCQYLCGVLKRFVLCFVSFNVPVHYKCGY